MTPRTRKAVRTAGTAVVIAVLLVAAGSCKKDATGPTQASVTVTNTCGAAVDVSMDGVFRNLLENGASTTITPVTVGSHLFEAKLTGTQTLVRAQTIEVAANVNYFFEVLGPSTISITNQYGEILKIYVKDAYLGDIGNGLTQTIQRVRFGTYEFTAKKKSDDTVVATTTIEVTEIRDYPWIITP